ncbi:MAG: alpha/beta hydrolase [Myxococcota bacterium]
MIPLFMGLLACGSPAPEPTLPAVDCPFEPVGGAVCYRLDTPADYVVVTVIPATGRRRLPPLVLQNGGPGSSPWDDYGPLFATDLREAFGVRRDLVLVETRGSRYSGRPLACDAYLDKIQTQAPDSEVADALIRCFDDWHAEGVDFSAVTGPRLADDIVNAVQQLGYDSFDYYGGSFGTIIGQHLVRDHDAHVGTLVLDAVVPVGVNYVDALPRSADEALATLDAACRADPTCGYEDVPRLLETRLAALDAEPVAATVDGRTILVDGDAMAALVQGLLYFGEAAEYIPRLVAFEGEDVGELYGSVLEQLGTDERWSEEHVVGLNLAATCGETRGIAAEPYTSSDFGARVGLGLPVDELCDVLGLAANPDAERARASTADPVLLLSGQHDPVTPPRWAQEIEAEFPRGIEVTLSGTGHGGLVSDCGLQTLISFLDDPENPDLGACRNDDSIELQPPL